MPHPRFGLPALAADRGRPAPASALAGGAGCHHGRVTEVDEALDRLRAAVAAHGPMVVAFSGGADSALLAHVATEVLGAGTDGARCATAVSPSLPDDELADCRALADEWGLAWEPVTTDELDDPAYRANGPDRCARCKDALWRALEPLAGGAAVALGVNVDDLGDHRPGQELARERGAVFPLVEAGFTKELVRAASRQLGLRTADKPAAACLASRLPYGTPVTLGRLGQVERAEAGLRRLGFGALRVRHHGEVARLEVPIDRLAEVVDRREEVAEALRGGGFRYVALDLDGLRSGSLNPLPTA